MLLTCPKCSSGLQVPDGTTAMVRCPACKTVFSPADSAGAAAPEPEEERPEPEPERPKMKVVVRKRDEDEKPKKKEKKKGEDEDEKKEENRDFDPITEEEDRKRKRKKRKPADDDLSPEEKAARRAAFTRASIGAKLIWISFALFMLSMVIILIFFFQLTFKIVTPAYITVAGLLGLINWILAAVGIGLCLSGPRAPGHWGYGISAAVAAAVHLIFLIAVVAGGKEYSIGKDEKAGDVGNVKWGLLPTRIDATMFYLTAIVYSNEQGATPRGPMLLSMITGVAEMVRTVMIMMLLSCLARSALDEELAHKCTRAAGIASGGPGLVALIMLVFIAAMIETNAGLNMFTLILFMTVHMSVYAILIGVILPSFFAARETDDACAEPFQSLIPKL